MQVRPLRQDPIPLAGGLDLVSIPLLVKPGRCIASTNYEPDINGGYSRIAGIERYDGRTKPSAANYSVVNCTITGSVSVGNTITGVTSAATAKVLYVVSASRLIVTRVSGTFVAETFNVGGSPQGTISSVAEDGELSMTLHAEYKNAVADDYRTDIQKPTGSGSIRGTVHYGGYDYAFRDNAGGTACVMYKATASGWSAVTFGREIQFSTAVGEIFEGDTVTGFTSGATGVVRRALLRTGTWTVNGVGTLVFDSVTGAFQSGEALRVGGVTKATSTSVDTAIALSPGGKFEFDIANFNGTSDRLYCVDGVNIPGEFDGTRWVPIRTASVSATPKFVKSHRKHLVFATSNQIITSGTGEPYSYTALTGAARLLVAREITGLMPETGDVTSGALVVTTSKEIYILYGSDTSDFNLVLHAPTSGARAYTLQNIGITHFLDTQGVTHIYASQAFGNFQMKVVTSAIQPLIDAKIGLEVASCVVRKKNQYRIFFSDGTGIILQLTGGVSGRSVSCMYFDYGVAFNTVHSFVDSTGAERILAGGTDGYVYELDVGTSFDGANIKSLLMLQFNHSGTVMVRKNYLRTILQLNARGMVNVRCGYDLGFGRLGTPQSNYFSKTLSGQGGYWDAILTGDYVWDGGSLQELKMHTPGNGDSIAIVVSGDTDLNPPYTITACIPYYKLGRFER